jgi:Tetratricopeptide repeat
MRCSTLLERVPCPLQIANGPATVVSTARRGRALATAEKVFGPDNQNVGISLGHLAALYRDQGRYAAAEPLLKRALAIAERARGPLIVGLELSNLATAVPGRGPLRRGRTSSPAGQR